IDRRAVEFERFFDHIDGADDAGAESARRTEQDFEWRLLVGHHIGGQLSMGGRSCQVPATARYKHVKRKSGVNPEFQVMATLYRRPVCLIAACGLASLMAASSAWADSANSSDASTSSSPAQGVQL